MFLNAQTLQNMETSQTSSVKDKVVPCQMGSVQTDQGVCTITFDSPMTTDYTIMLTPCSDKTTLFVSEKTTEKVVIKTRDGSDILFDYIVFIKREKPQPPEQK
jgi:hypothetical protein